MLAILARLFSSLKLNINYDTFPHGTVHVSSDIKHIHKLTGFKNTASQIQSSNSVISTSVVMEMAGILSFISVLCLSSHLASNTVRHFSPNTARISEPIWLVRAIT